MCHFGKALQFLAIAVIALAAAPLAWAHAHPTAMMPMANSAGPAPKMISITFSEGIEPKFSSITLTDANGKSADSNVSKAKDAKTLTLDVPTLAPGTYIVHWKNVSTDGHSLAGEYKFTVK